MKKTHIVIHHSATKDLRRPVMRAWTYPLASGALRMPISSNRTTYWFGLAKRTSRPSTRCVLPIVVGTTHYDKVGSAVVRPVPVQVVDMLSPAQSPPKCRLHYMPVLVAPTALSPDSHISVLHQSAVAYACLPHGAMVSHHA